MPKLEQFEIKKYWQIFSGLKPVDNKLTHDHVQPILFNSKLDSSILNKIWFLADIDDDDNLDFEEFVICMRLIFDMVNKNIDRVPDDLPDWLVPGSKIKLLKQRKTRDEPQENTQSSNAVETHETAPVVQTQRPPSPPPKLDWYIAPSNKALYTSIYDSCEKLTDGTISYAPLLSAVRTNFPKISSADFDHLWVLVNPQNIGSINKDPAVFLIHALKQRNDSGCELPADLPHAFKEICNQQRVSYDLKSHQADITRHSRHTNTSNSVTPQDSGSGRSASRTQVDISNKSGFDANEAKAIEGSNPEIARAQLEELYAYLQRQASGFRNSNSSVDVRGINEDIGTIEQQVGILEQFLAGKKQELQELQSENQSLRA